ncbi:GH36-type glycosyl hydrolase domain-containing protein [Teredinibacter turnerae]|uniref:GH36-type glycosyl hydrolase domain-containing protein n=1 Tax=Teredinibacter turnerae TaxID=2426 RepID=UPI0003630976|nr:NdvB protein [Teredinibacter turnerae]
MLKRVQNGERYELHSPTAMPQCAGFLWNKKMMIQVTCRGYAIAQHMQPEPAKYSYQPIVEGKIFMLPEQPMFAHTPGRFFFVKDEETGEFFSAPHEPVRAKPDTFVFSVGKSDLRWRVEKLGIRVELQLTIPKQDVAELWQLKITNLSGRSRKISVYPYMTLGFMSWMNQSARYREDLGGIVGSCVTPYQKLDDYFKNKNLKDKTFFLHDRAPTHWEACRDIFEGEGGVQRPSGVQADTLGDGDALYETPAGIFQYRLAMAPRAVEDYRFILGPALDDAEIAQLREQFFTDPGFTAHAEEYARYVAEGEGVLTIATDDADFDNFVNHWLPRQVFYHGDVNRLSTDPQTRNFLQDSMGMSYVRPQVTKEAFLWALAQQEENGSMPDGVLLREDAELKYINQIPHTDHCVWLPVCLTAYLNETADYDFLQLPVKDWKGSRELSVFERINAAMRWLLSDRDARGLNYIAQGDWNDPMNMVGYKGKGVSGWLSVATAYGLRVWSQVCEHLGERALAEEFATGAAEINQAVNKYLWDGDWYGRGITDDDVVFGVAGDEEGRIFLNPQSWALMAGTPTESQRGKMLDAIDAQLDTPYGVMMLAPAYTKMREDVGRVTQKHPGAAENGSIYNHAAAFYAWSLFCVGEADRGYEVIRKMIAGPDEADLLQRGQMPVFIPNYYRGAYYQFPRTAGRSSQLFNTGTVSWVYRSLVEGLFGLVGCPEGLRIQPQLPSHWHNARVTRAFRGAELEVHFFRVASVTRMEVSVDGVSLPEPFILSVQEGSRYTVEVRLPRC